MSREWTEQERKTAEKQLVTRLPNLAERFGTGTLDSDEYVAILAVDLQCELNEALDLLTRTQGGIRNMDEHEEWQRQVQAFFDRNRTK